PGVLPRIGCDLERLANSAGSHHHGRCFEQHAPSTLTPVSEGTGNTVAVLRQFRDGAFRKDLDARLVVSGGREVFLLKRDNLLLHRPNDLESGAVTDVSEPRIRVTTEVALTDSPVRRPIEQCAIGFEFPYPIRRLTRMQFCHSPVVE